MIDTNDLEVRNETDYYFSYNLVGGNVLFVAKTTVTYVDQKTDERVTRDGTVAECTGKFNSTFACAMIAGRDMIRKEECEKFTLQTVDVAKDEPDTGMIVLMTQ